MFKQFDLDGNNLITGDEIRSALAKMGKDISNDEIEHIMAKHDFSGDKQISLDEFKKMMLEDDNP